MPYRPVMCIPVIFIVRIIKTASRRGGRRPVKCIRRSFFYSLRKDLLKKAYIICPQIRGLFLEIAPVMPCGLNLIIAANQSEAGMVPEPFQIIQHFLPAVLRKMVCHLIYVACKHQVLPDDQSVPVAEIIEPVRRIISAAPYPDTVIICPDHGTYKILLSFLCNSCVKTILGDIIPAHSKYLHTVYHKGKFPAPFILVPADCQSPQADGLLCPVRQSSPCVIMADFDSVQRLLSVSCRPPELRLPDCQLRLSRTGPGTVRSVPAGSYHLRLCGGSAFRIFRIRT